MDEALFAALVWGLEKGVNLDWMVGVFRLEVRVQLLTLEAVGLLILDA